MKISTGTIALLAYLMIMVPNAGGQTGVPRGAAQEALPENAARLFADVEDAIQQSQPDGIVAGLARQVYLDLPGREGGYYSANQARPILQEYYKNRKTVHFRFGTKGLSQGIPFATGGGMLVTRGIRSAFQVYVSLVRHNDRWVISQFSVY